MVEQFTTTAWKLISLFSSTNSAKTQLRKKEKRNFRTVKCCLKMKQIGNKYVVVPPLMDAHALNQLLQKQKIIPRKELQYRT